MTQKKSSLPMENRPPMSPAGNQTKAPSVSFADGMKVLSKRTIPSNVYRVGQNQAPAQSLAVGSAKASNVVQSPTSIVELARALKNDVDLIYQHVRNQIDYTPMQGLQKGSFGALADGLAGPFDQCQLMVDLLREAGHTADFVFGEIDLSNEEVSNWLGTDSSSIFNAAFLLAEAGIFNAPYDSGGGVFRNKISHIWVKVNIDGTDYHFDPSFKSYTETAGIDLATVMGYDQATLLSDAAAGATVDPSGNWVENVNKSNIDSKLTDYSTNLINWIKANNPTATFDEIVGGRTLDQETAQVRQTELPYLSAGTTPTIWTTIPDTFRIVVDISEPVSNISQTFFGDELYGRRLTVFFDQFNRPQLSLDGALVQGGNSVTQGTAINFTVHFVHPYPTTFFDEFVNVRLFTPYTAAQGGGRNYYTIGLMFGTPQQGLIDVQEQELAENIANGGQELDEEVLGVRLGILWNTFAAENARNADILGRMTKCAMVLHHWAGAVSFEDNRNAGIFDLSSGLRFSAVSVDGNPNNVKKFSGAWTIHGNSLERLALQQVSGNPDGFSGSSQLEVANADGTRIYRGTNANWATDVFPNLDTAGTYANGPNLNTVITPWLADGWIVLLPQEGDQTLGSIITDGWNFQHPNGGAAGFLVPNKGGIGPWDWADKCKRKECEKEESDPVGLSTGAYKYRQTDMTIGATNFPYKLSMDTDYTSTNAAIDGPLGFGWTHNWMLSSGLASEPFRGLGVNTPIEAAASIVQMLVCIDLFDDADPGIIKMMTTWLANGWWCDQMTSNIVSFETIDQSSAEFVIQPDGSFQNSEFDGSTLALVSGEYILTTKEQNVFTYGVDGNLKTIEFPYGVTITLSYSGGRLSSVTNGLGRTLSFFYTGDKLTSVSDGNGRTVAYSFDVDNQLVAITDLNGEDTTFSYSGLGQIESYFLPENPSDAMVTNTYDALGRVQSQLDMNNKMQSFYFAGWRTEFENAVGDSMISIFDANGNTIEEVDELGNVTSFEYDGLNRLARQINPEGNTVSKTYDSNDNTLTRTRSPKPGSPLTEIVETFTYDPVFNKVATHVDGRGNTTTFSYDPNTGNLIKIERPNIGIETPTVEFTYNDHGQVLTRQDESGMVAKFEYDSVSDVLTKVTVDEGVGRLNLVTSMGYNSWGDLISIIDARGNEFKQLFDNKRRLTQTESPPPFGYISNFTYDKNDNRMTVERQTGDVVHPWQVYSSEYNIANQLVSLTDPRGNVQTKEYDDLRRLVKSTDAENRITEFQFDAHGMPAKVIDGALVDVETNTYTDNGQKATVSDGKGNITQYTYDGFDRLESIIFPDGTFEKNVSYDGNDNITAMLTRAGDTVAFVYDPLNRLVQKSPDGQSTVIHEYDLVGRLTKTTTPILAGDPTSGAFEFSYDTAGRFVAEKYPDGKEFQYELDENGNTTRITYTDGYFVEREYDELNRLVDVKLNGDTQAALHFDFDDLSRRTKLTYQNGNTVDHHYDELNISSMVHVFDGNPVTFSYGYNKANQLNSQSVSDSQFMWHPDQTETVNYAAANNLNQYPQVKNKSYSYDSNGNLGNNNDFDSFTYDTESRLIQCVKPGIQVDYFHDPFNRNLLLKHDDNGTVESEEYRYAKWQLLEEYENGALKFRYIFGENLDEPLIRIRVSNNRHRYFHADAVGSIIAHARADGVLARVYLYSPFGDSPSMGGTTFGFTGQRYDGQTRLHYYKHRFYDRKIGRFLQPDLILGDNLYMYAWNDPLNFVDILGLDPDYSNNGRNFYNLDSEPDANNALFYGCSGLTSILQGTPGRLAAPEIGDNTKCYATKKQAEEAAKKDCCKDPFIFNIQGKWNPKLGKPVPDPDTGEVSPRSIDKDLPYNFQSAPCGDGQFVGMNNMVGWGPQAIWFGNRMKKTGPDGKFPEEIWCVTCRGNAPKKNKKKCNK